MASPSHLRLFGIPALVDAEGRPRLFRTKKQLALMVYLALEARQRAVSREHLADLLWDDVIPERGRHSLSQGLSVIRQHLGRDALSRGPGPIRLLCQLSTDLDRIATDGLLPWQTDQPLQELDDAGSGAFAHWVEVTRASCLRMVRQSLADQLDSARSSGNLQRVHERAAELYRVDPYSDAAVHALAEQYLLEGDASGAIRLLRTHLDRMAEELQCNPHPNVERLLKRIEKGIVSVAKQGPATPPQIIQQRPEIFLGRDEEMSRLEAIWEEARGGSLKTCLVTGPAGIGKSTLVRRFATSVASRAWPVWQVACQEIGINIPFAAVSELIHALLREPAVSGADPRSLAEASRVTPSLRSAYPGVPEPPPVAPESVRIRVAEALAHMLEAAADSAPFLLILDDIQQMDQASRDVMRVLMRRIETRPGMLLSARRTTEDDDWLRTRATSDDLASAIVVPVQPLTTPLAVRLVDRLCSDLPEERAPIRTTIAAFALGNPYLIEMLASDWLHNGRDSLAAAYARGEHNAARWRPPETMRSAFQRQYHALTGDAERLLELLAVARRQIPPTESAALLAVPPQTVDRAALELIRRGIVRADGTNLTMKNEVHRAFVYYAMSDERRTYHHAVLARLLYRRSDGTDFQRDLEASSHFLNAGMIAEAAAAVDRSAEAAIAQGAASEVEHTLTAILATDAAPRPDRLRLLLAQSLAAQGEYRSTFDTLQCISEGNLEPGRDLAVLHSLRAKSLQVGGLTDASLALAAAQTASAAASAYGSEADQVSVYQTMAEAAYDSDDLDLLADVKAKVGKLGAASRDRRVQQLAHMTAGYCMLVSGDWRGAIGSFARFLRTADSQSGDPEEVRVINGLGMALAAVGRYTAAAAAYERAVQLSKQSGNAQAAVNSLSNLGVLFDDLGRYRSALDTYREALQLADWAAAPRRVVDLHRNFAGLALSLGSFVEAREFILQAREQARKLGHSRLEASVHLMEGNYHLSRGDPDAAWRVINETELLFRHGSGALDLWNLHWLVKGYCLWCRYGDERLHRMLNERARLSWKPQLAHRLPVELMVEWINAREGRQPPQERTAMHVVHERSLYGVVAAVVAIGVVPHGLPEPRPGESSAQFVCRVFPARKAEDVRLCITPGNAQEGKTCEVLEAEPSPIYIVDPA